MTRWHDCRLAEVINNPTLGPAEVKFAQVIVAEHIQIADEEIGDTLDSSDEMLLRAEKESGIRGVFIRRFFIRDAVVNCLANRYLGNCASGSCAGSRVAEEFIEDVVAETEGSSLSSISID